MKKLWYYKNNEDMEATVRKRRTTHPITHYWGLVKDMDDSQKLQLITMLAESVKPAPAEPKKSRKKKLDACDYAGIWSDEEYMDADELVKEIHDARCYNPKRDEFLEKFFTEP